jgi:hypothetical protein
MKNLFILILSELMLRFVNSDRIETVPFISTKVPLPLIQSPEDREGEGLQRQVGELMIQFIALRQVLDENIGNRRQNNMQNMQQQNEPISLYSRIMENLVKFCYAAAFVLLLFNLSKFIYTSAFH